MTYPSHMNRYTLANVRLCWWFLRKTPRLHDCMSILQQFNNKVNEKCDFSNCSFLLSYEIEQNHSHSYKFCETGLNSQERINHRVLCLVSPPTIPVIFGSQVYWVLMSSFFWSSLLHWKLAVLLQVLVGKKKNPCSLIYNDLLTVLLGGKGEHLCKWAEFLLRE